MGGWAGVLGIGVGWVGCQCYVFCHGMKPYTTQTGLENEGVSMAGVEAGWRLRKNTIRH